MSWIKSTRLPVLSHRFVVMFIFLTVVLVSNHALAVADAEPNPIIQNLPANTWYEVPDSKMSQVEAGREFFSNITDPASAYLDSRGMFPFSGGAFDSIRNRLIIWGGGHAAYFGNEIYTFDLTDFSWQRITDPSIPMDPETRPCPSLLSDGNPNSRHTYYNLDYIPTIDRFFSTPGGALSCFHGGVDPNTWTFDFDNKQWVNMKPDSKFDGDGKPIQPPVWAPIAAAYNPLDNKVYSAGPEGLFVYDVESNRWDKLDSTALWLDRGMAVDLRRGLLVVVGAGEVVVYDLANQDYKPQFWDTQGDEAYNVDNEFRPGVNYDPVVDRIVVWDGGAVRALNMDTRQWSDLAVAPQERPLKGTYGRFRYSQRENAYVLVNDSRENVLIYKLTDNAAALSILVQPVAVTVDQGQTATFRVMAVGSGTLSYQWRKNGDDIDGATMAHYNLSASDMTDSGMTFDVVVSNGTASATSDGATLTIEADTLAPTLATVFAVGNSRVDIVFSEPVSASSAEIAGNYQIDFGIGVNSAELSSDNRTITLTVSLLTADTDYTVQVSNVQDLAHIPNTIAFQSSRNFIYRDADGFDDGTADGWAPLNAINWSVELDESDMAYCINTSNVSPLEGNRLGEYALLPTAYDDFILTVQARLGGSVADNNLADYAVVFGFQDPENYYYVMFNNSQNATQLFKVVDGTRAAALDTADEDWLNDNSYHGIKVSRVGDEISVYFDDILIMNANDNTFGVGRVGVGSYNDSACFDDVNVTEATVAASDEIAPVITLNGSDPQTIIVGTSYTELGATVNDNVDGDLSDRIMVDATSVDTNSIGSYQVTYNATDAAGNAAVQIVRTINVVAATGSGSEDPNGGGSGNDGASEVGSPAGGGSFGILLLLVLFFMKYSFASVRNLKPARLEVG